MTIQRRTWLSRTLCAALAVAGLSTLCSPALAHPGHPDSTFQARQDRERTPAMLTDEDINLIQVYEVHLDSDPAPRIDIDKAVLRKFLEEYKEDDRVPRGKEAQEEFLRADGKDQLDKLFKVRARDYYKEVRIRSTIESLRSWGNHHRKYLLAYFQPTFGENKVKGLYLFGQGQDRERIELTNFYILTQTTIDGKPLIDRFNPAESLLLQWGLPREEAKFAAPDIDGWRPYFKDAEDKKYVELVDWIKSLIPENQGSDYGIEYKLPGQPREREPE